MAVDLQGFWKGCLGGASEQCGRRELRETGPAGNIEGCLRVREEGRVIVVIVEHLSDLGERSFLLCAGGSLPIKAKTGVADGAKDIGGVAGGFAKGLHGVFPFVFMKSRCSE
jgi:hypothetical protein